uniref:Uncharacterized protein n=1 Tax=Spongospora subterranea TaxID=70186 RepID=A0A0H5R9G9_9EUKA|eukprot:CRZ10322.1 hypothetical protein [Spongospora subterranea]
MARPALSRLDQNTATAQLDKPDNLAKLVKPEADSEIAKLKSELLRKERMIQEQQLLINNLRSSLLAAVVAHEQDEEQIRQLNHACGQIAPLQSHLAELSMLYSLVQYNA